MPPGFEPHHSGGMVENSPAFQRRDSGEREPSLAGTAELDCVSRPCGTYPPGASNPALKRRAIAVCPSGTETAPETAHPVIQKALEILRREVPPLAQVQSPTPEVQSPEAAIQPPGTERTAFLPAPHPELRSKITPALDFRPETLDCAAPLSEVRIPRYPLKSFLRGCSTSSWRASSWKAGTRCAARRSIAAWIPARAICRPRRRRNQRTEDRGQKTALRHPQPSTLNSQPSTDEVIHSRSVQMGSDRLGVTAKIDRK